MNKAGFPPRRQNQSYNGRMNNPGAKRHLEARMRELKALDLRLEGLSYQQVADKVGVTEAGAHQIIMRVLDRFNTELREKAEQARRLELERCRKMLGYLQKRVRTGDPKAIGVALKISERVSRLQGLDAPTDVKVTGSGAGGAIPIEVFRRMLDEPDPAAAASKGNGKEA